MLCLKSHTDTNELQRICDEYRYCSCIVVSVHEPIEIRLHIPDIAPAMNRRTFVSSATVGIKNYLGVNRTDNHGSTITHVVSLVIGQEFDACIGEDTKECSRVSLQ